ncbi:MAG: Trk system potassium transporter TrkA [Clostridia bacterium]|nr:Trk system potassium transporter TrkA [Clostridia bacterium]
MKIIIVGCGKVGQKLAEKLSQENLHDITVIDLRYTVVQDITNQYDIMGVCGSGTSIDTLTEAGVEDADIVISVTGSDELNLLSCLIAKKVGNCQTIARVRKPEYVKEVHLFKEDLGLAMIINPELTAANAIARILHFPSAIQIDTFSKGRIEILKFRIPENSILDNLKIMDMASKLDCDILVCGVERGEDAFIPGGNFVMKQGDFISIVSTVSNATNFFKKVGIPTSSVKNTIIVGGGPISFYLARRLLLSGIDVKIIEQNQEKCDALCQALPKATIINGDGTERKLLLESGLDHADSFVPLTNIDEENVILSLFAKSHCNAKLVTKVNRIEYNDVVGGLDLGSIIYPKDLTAEYIVKFVRAMHNSIGSNIETMHLILDGKAEALEFHIAEDSPVTGITLEKLDTKDNTLIACINRHGQIITPRGSDMILPGDNVIVVTTHKGFNDIGDILR